MGMQKKKKGDGTKPYRAQLESAYELLAEDVTTAEKIEKIKTLISGINPKLDRELDKMMAAYNHLKAAADTNIVHLVGHTLPENTKVQKKHKKALLLFLASWRSLKSEVERVNGYYEDVSQTSSVGHHTGVAVKSVLFAKGAFGVITGLAILAVGAYILYQKAFTEITIENEGCPPIAVPGKLPISIPGLRLPEESITEDKPGTAALPSVTVSVHESSRVLTATVIGQTGTYVLPARTDDVIFDGTSLMGKTTALNLKNARSHQLVIKCR